MKRLLHAEWYKLFHDRIFWCTCAAVILFNFLLFSGSSLWAVSGHSALIESMKKEIATVLIACIYGGVSLGGDFAEGTFFHSLLSGKGRGTALLAKAIVYAFATDFLLFIFPLLWVLLACIRNGWGIPVSSVTFAHITGMTTALLLLGFAISAIPLLAAVCFRDVGRTVGLPITLYFVMILCLNSPGSAVFLRILPIGTLILVADGTASPAYGVLLGTLWFAFLSIGSVLLFRRAELH